MRSAALLLTLLAATTVQGGPLAYGICQAGCSKVVTACYSAGGFVFGTVTAGVGTPAAVLDCTSSYGKCQNACAAVALSPTL
ncbi:hypothetical protein T439DRAFT_360903 [Meredithblackwellia eburnea MCA 4105]